LNSAATGSVGCMLSSPLANEHGAAHPPSNGRRNTTECEGSPIRRSRSARSGCYKRRRRRYGSRSREKTAPIQRGGTTPTSGGCSSPEHPTGQQLAPLEHAPLPLCELQCGTP
jgi:hypothetical protein